jgi:hypothetical protein
MEVRIMAEQHSISPKDAERACHKLEEVVIPSILKQDSFADTASYVAAVLDFLTCIQPLEGAPTGNTEEFGRSLILTACSDALRAYCTTDKMIENQ